MKILFPFLVLLSFLWGCKVSNTITVDSISNLEMLKGYQNFQLVAEDYTDTRNERIKLIFRNKLLEYGFDESPESPDFLIQGIVVTRKFIQELGYYSSIPGPFYNTNNTGNNFPSAGTNGLPVNKGMIGKVIFIIQDAKTNKIAWMGVSSGIVSGDRQLDLEDLDLALDELLAFL
jgi:hypothetical protein